MSPVQEAATYQNLIFAREGAIAIVTLNRPERRNALSLALMQELVRCLDEIGRDREIRAVILAAAGKVFCSGHDLSEMTGRNIKEYRNIFDVCTQLMEKIQSIPQPVIAEVQGIATAAGCQLVAACDLAVASDQASFATPGVKIGLFCSTPMVPLTRAIGSKHAFEMLVTGEMVDAKTAAEWGLVNRAVPAAELDGAVDEYVTKLAAKLPQTTRYAKQQLNFWRDLSWHETVNHARDWLALSMLGDEAQEAVKAFLKRSSS